LWHEEKILALQAMQRMELLIGTDNCIMFWLKET
jgi:hypothetical protein